MTVNHVELGNSLDYYSSWDTPHVIISDGAYGINGFPGDPKKVELLPEWYKPHVEAWSKAATSQTSLWFWNTEEGWATVHPTLITNGWKYIQLCTWNKGMAHAAGNVNSNTIRRFPVVTEVSALYVRQSVFESAGTENTVQEWLRSEWKRSGLPFSEANTACGVKNAASRKWLTSDAMWYIPPYDMLQKLKEYADLHGDPENAPYFMDEGNHVKVGKWKQLRAKWNHTHGITNVWDVPSLRNSERVKNSSGKNFHTNQKPLILMERQIAATTDKDDVVWEPFGGMCTASAAAKKLTRSSYAAEMNTDYHAVAAKRIQDMQVDETV